MKLNSISLFEMNDPLGCNSLIVVFPILLSFAYSLLDLHPNVNFSGIIEQNS